MKAQIWITLINGTFKIKRKKNKSKLKQHATTVLENKAKGKKKNR